MTDCGSGWDGAWRPDPASATFFEALRPGQQITVAKWGANGEEIARYPALVVSSVMARPWIEVEAHWTFREVEEAGLRFVPGDTLREFFSPAHPYNAFAVYAPDGHFRGWYGNVTCPAFVVHETGGPVLVWRDLHLDAVVVPGQDPVLLDDDELAASGLAETDADFARAIVAARDDLISALPSFPVLNQWSFRACEESSRP